MKKRMIAWLLCACMTFTAAPEMLLADVAGKEHQQTQEENSFKEKETAETQTAEQDDEKSAVTEKTETDQAGEEDHNARRLAEEMSGMAETKIVTEEAEDSDAEIVTEETEINESESAGNVWTSESEVMEDSETGIVTEETAETEQVETETVTEETESIELTAEEQEQIEQEVMDEISFFSASDSYSLTEEQLAEEDAPDLETIRASVEERLQGTDEFGEAWQIYVYRLKDGARASLGQGRMTAASLIKLYIMGAVYSSYDNIVATNGQEQVDKLLNAMITVSDNDSANTLVGMLGNGDNAAGQEAVNTYCKNIKIFLQ